MKKSINQEECMAITQWYNNILGVKFGLSDAHDWEIIKENLKRGKED